MRVMKLMKLLSGLGALGLVGMVISCGTELVDAFDAAKQQEIDIDLIEEYLSDNGYTDYDTLDIDVRVVILEKGTGETMDYNDNIQFDFIAKFTNDTIFDTSIAQVAYDQDTANMKSFVLERDDNDQLELDRYGLQGLDDIKYDAGYSAIYSSKESYKPLITTHSIEGWFIRSQTYSVKGLPAGVHHVLDNVRVGGRGLVLLPSFLAYGRVGTSRVDENTIVIFEIRPVEKR